MYIFIFFSIYVYAMIFQAYIKREISYEWNYHRYIFLIYYCTEKKKSVVLKYNEL